MLKAVLDKAFSAKNKNVGTAALGCPVERSSTALWLESVGNQKPRRSAAEQPPSIKSWYVE